VALVSVLARRHRFPRAHGPLPPHHEGDQRLPELGFAGHGAERDVLAPRSQDAHPRPHRHTRLVAHLPLVVPPGCGFHVGGETREWRAGEAFVFDDTIEHEAWNNSDEMRAILIVDVWTPLISDAERELSRALSARVSKYYGKLENEPAPVRTTGFASVA
jgi:aspartate beta-hydroxylase